MLQRRETLNKKYFGVLLVVWLVTGVLGAAIADESKTETKSSTIRNSIGMEFVLISPGEFMMGSPPNEPGRDIDERLHRVTITRSFYLQTTEVTQKQWKTVMGFNPAGFKTCGEDCPVETISWNETHEFISKLNQLEGTDKYRLPTEAEWEYACRAGTETPFFTGLCILTDRANYNGKFPIKGCPEGQNRKTTMKIGSFVPNPWGLYDMHGNVWEWCQDWYAKGYPKNAVDPRGPFSGTAKVLRGGAWFSKANMLRSSYRRKDTPDFRSHVVGFRLVKIP